MTFLISDNGTDRSMTNDEIAELKELQKNAAIQAQAKVEAEAKKAEAKAALLDRLGITAEEAKLLLA